MNLVHLIGLFGCAGETARPEPLGPDLEISFLGVGGYLMRWQGAAILTPPFYTNPGFVDTTFDTIASDPALVERFSADWPLEEVRAILVGHAHYDHLMDVPTLWARTEQAPIYGNATVGHVLAAFAPDRDPACTEPPTAIVIPRDRVIRLEVPDAALGQDRVDRRSCPEALADAGEGDWIDVPEAHARFRAICSSHAAQIGEVHFAEGSIDDDLCAPPAYADEWLQGLTLAFLIDFLDPDTGATIHRVFYQDAPTEPPIGMPVPELLAKKRVDVALLNVGSYVSVDDHPRASLEVLTPRYTVGGHWEDFFRTQDEPFVALYGHDVSEYESGAADGLPPGHEPAALVDGTPDDARHWVPDPGTTFVFPADAGTPDGA